LQNTHFTRVRTRVPPACFRDPALTDGAVDLDCTVCDANEIEAAIGAKL
jgi:hypothetical protein